jgi:hypothetical protein
LVMVRSSVQSTPWAPSNPVYEACLRLAWIAASKAPLRGFCQRRPMSLVGKGNAIAAPDRRVQ